MRVVLAQPRGFCAGVERAIEIVERALEKFGPPIYVRHEIVHNRHVVERLRAKGAHFVDEIDEIPTGAVTIFSAHGVSPQVRKKAAAKHLQVIDATCPLVTKVHLETLRFAGQGRTIILVGHKGHEEVEGTTGEAPDHIRVVGSVEEAETIRVPDPDRVLAAIGAGLRVIGIEVEIDLVGELAGDHIDVLSHFLPIGARADDQPQAGELGARVVVVGHLAVGALHEDAGRRRGPESHRDRPVCR